MPVSKKTKMKRQGVTLQRQSGRRKLLQAATKQAKRSHNSSIDAGDSSSSSTAKLTRSNGSRNVLAGRPKARRERAQANADLRPPTTLANPVRKRANGIDNGKQAANKAEKGKTAKSKRQVDTKIDFATGRVLFPVEVNGKTQYLPVASEANEVERRNGSFVSLDSIQQDPVNTIDTNAEREMVHDVQNQRQLYATLDASGEQEYLPLESDATALEIANGKYIPDDKLTAPSVAMGLLDVPANRSKQLLVYDFTNQRNLFAVRTRDGRDINVPVKSEASASELKRGLYIDDAEISKKIDLSPAKAMTNDPEQLDLVNQRMVYAVKNDKGKTVYFAKESEATALERARGLFIPDEVVIKHQHQRRRTALRHRDTKAQSALRRAQRADKLAGGVTASNINAVPEAVTRAKDGTELWDGFSVPEVSLDKQQQVLRTLEPVYDLNENRMLYPTVTAKGKTKYLPLLKDATDVERITQNYAAFVPQQSLADVIAQAKVQRQSFDTDEGEVKAFIKADVDQAFANVSNLTLKSAALVSEAAKLTPALQQQWKE